MQVSAYIKAMCLCAQANRRLQRLVDSHDKSVRCIYVGCEVPFTQGEDGRPFDYNV